MSDGYYVLYPFDEIDEALREMDEDHRDYVIDALMADMREMPVEGCA